jgi:hypothetical protein
MSDRLFVATRKGLFTVQRSAGGWQIARAAFLADNLPIVLPDSRDGAVYAAIQHGHFGAKLHRSPDGGETWKEIAVPAFPEPPGGTSPDKCPMRGIPIPWKVELIWSLEAGGKDEPGVLWCGTIPGGLFRSEDCGASWRMVTSLWENPARKEWFGGGMDFPGIHSICVDPRDSRRVAVGISCGGVWATRDGGATWACRATGMRAAYLPPEQAGNPNQQDPHRLVRCPSSPEALWVQHHNGIFRTTNDAGSWTELTCESPSSFGFAVAVHPRHADTAWFVPAEKDERRLPVGGQVVVTRTRDGGRSFEVLRKGLPQVHAYDIVFRHALDVDESGDRLAFGSTTGSLWVSEDQGDSWVQVSAHLPPVYCVRFAGPGR